MNHNIKILHELESITPVLRDEPLKEYTTFKTGGPAALLAQPKTRGEIRRILALAGNAGVPVTIMGGGSNLLVSDKGIPGLVVRLCSVSPVSGDMAVLDSGEIYCSAHVRKSDFIEFCIDRGYSGMEFLAGIPGVMGGGIVMNAGTNMGTYTDILTMVELIDSSGEVQTLPVTAEMASYRNLNLPSGSVVTAGYYRLKSGSNIEETRAAIQEIGKEREEKHPLEYPSAGSVFKNPPGHSSWKLIQDAGLKGMTIGGAMVSEKHTNFIINTGGATSSDVRQLIDHIKSRVSRLFQVELETEIRMLGEF